MLPGGSLLCTKICPLLQNVIYCCQRFYWERGTSMKIPANGFTHAGKFHADDVFATALLQIIAGHQDHPCFVVPDDFDGIVYDIGFGMFDHHQEPASTAPTASPMRLRPAVAGAGPGAGGGAVRPGSSMKTYPAAGSERQHRRAEQPVRCPSASSTGVGFQGGSRST